MLECSNFHVKVWFTLIETNFKQNWLKMPIINPVYIYIFEEKHLYINLYLVHLHIMLLTRIPIPSCVYLIDTGYEGRARDSRHPPPPSTRRSISHWWARWVSVACLGHVLRGGDAPGGGEGVRGVSAPHIQWTEPIHTKFYNFLISY
jgi:hypothetical protein